jgi:putative endonuclease
MDRAHIVYIMSWVYILRNSKTDRYYIGSTDNLERRLKQHSNGHTRTTRVLETFELVYKEEYMTIPEAREREKKLKSYKSKKYLKWLIGK